MDLHVWNYKWRTATIRDQTNFEPCVSNEEQVNHFSIWSSGYFHLLYSKLKLGKYCRHICHNLTKKTELLQLWRSLIYWKANTFTRFRLKRKKVMHSKFRKQLQISYRAKGPFDHCNRMSRGIHQEALETTQYDNMICRRQKNKMDKLP